MKHLVLTLLLAVSLTANGEELIFGDLESGGFGGPTVGFGTMKGSLAVCVGGRGGWLINHSFVIGGMGSGLATLNTAHDYGLDSTDFVTFGYGGLLLEYIFMNEKVLHPTLSLVIGGGSVSTHRTRHEDIDTDWDINNPSRTVFVLEPAVGLELNIAHFCRFDVFASYRYVSNFTVPDVTRADIRGMQGTVMLKFGKF